MITSPELCDVKLLEGYSEILPEADQNMLLELTKKSLLAYDPDYTRLLPGEKANLEEALSDFENGINIDDGSEIEW